MPEQFEVLTANPVYYRTYSRWINDKRETWNDTIDRCIKGLKELGKLTDDEINLIKTQALSMRSIPSGRWLWVGGTDWVNNPANFSGAYNCSGFQIDTVYRMAFMMDLLMQGCGAGTLLEQDLIDKLPPINHRVKLEIVGNPGDRKGDEKSTHRFNGDSLTIEVGDSRGGWASAYQMLILVSMDRHDLVNNVKIDISGVRANGSKINGFGGVSNAIALPAMFKRVNSILNGAVGRKLTSVEVCLLLDEASKAVVAGNVRRSANIRQFSHDDELAKHAKDNLWQQSDDGSWKIDPKRDALRMGNHTRVFHHKPTLDECIESVRKQYYSGEGAIQWAGEAVARANVDLLSDSHTQAEFLDLYDRDRDLAAEYLKSFKPEMGDYELNHRMRRYILNPCAEIIGCDFMCNLYEVHLNNLDPLNLEAQRKAFKAAAIGVSVLLHHEFTDEKQKQSRELDPIVGVSFTGLFDFFVNLFGVEWLRWWQAGRSDDWDDVDDDYRRKLDLIKQEIEYIVDGQIGFIFKSIEEVYLAKWQFWVDNAVDNYCHKHGLKTPNRCTAIQPAGTKSLLTGASPGWHPPKAAYYIRRITMRKGDPVALACLEAGYSVVPSQSDKDEQGNLLTDPFDPRCTEWLIEIPCATKWAHLPGVEDIDIANFSALAQFDFYMQVQQYYTQHNTSATIELRENEIEPLANRIYTAIQNDEGYISAALLARFDSLETFPRLPFEPIDRHTYHQLIKEVASRSKSGLFTDFLSDRDIGDTTNDVGPMACDSDKCMMPDKNK